MMGELGAISNIGGQTIGGGAALRPQPDVKVPPVVSVETGSKGRDLSAGLNSGQPQAAPDKRFDPTFRAAQSERQAEPTAGERRADPSQLVGPSPAFQASVLELEQDLKNTIARVEAARGKRESDAAQGIIADPAPTREAVAEPTVQAGDDTAASNGALAESGPDSAPQTSPDQASGQNAYGEPKSQTEPAPDTRQTAGPPAAETAQTPQQAQLQTTATPDVVGETA